MKFLNEILIEWGKSETKDIGILSQDEISKNMGISWKEWQKKYILDAMPQNNFNHITNDIFLRKRDFLDRRGVFRKFYEIIDPYSDQFFKISIKMLEYILQTNASGDRAMMNWVFHTLLFGYPPKNFNMNESVKIRTEYEKLYKRLLTAHDQTILKNILKYINIDEISPEDLLDPVNEWYEEEPDPDGSILDIIMFLKPFEESWDIYRYLI